MSSTSTTSSPPFATALPNLLLIGAMRSGSTALARDLGGHPDIHMADQKELHFFDVHFDRGLDWYARHFDADSPVRGEATPAYLYSEDAPGRIAQILPDARLVVILRNPVDRAYSHYWQKRSYGREPLEFEDALEAEQARITAGDEDARRLFSYVDRGFYAAQLRRFSSFIDAGRLHVMLFERYEADPRSALRAVYSYLGVDSEIVPQAPASARNPYLAYRSKWLRRLSPRLPGLIARPVRRLNARPDEYPPMTPATRTRLLELFRPANEELANWLSLDLGLWDR